MRELSGTDLIGAVLNEQPRVVVFDCDGTLWAPDSGHGFMLWSFAEHLVSAERRQWLEQQYTRYEAGELGEEEICGAMVAVYAGLALHELQAAATRFFQQEIARQVFAPMLRLALALAENGAQLWAVSSTARWVVEAGLREAGFPIPPHRVLGAEVAVEHNQLTAHITAVPTGLGKRAALQSAGIPHVDAAFGNSVHDEAMLRMARFPCPVNASPALLAVAQSEDWPVFLPLGRSGHTVGGEGLAIETGKSES